MSDRDCNRCLYATRDGGCASWDCNFISIAEAEPKRGRWIADEHKPLKEMCSVCGFAQFQSRIKNFCPNCGAKMEASDD